MTPRSCAHNFRPRCPCGSYRLKRGYGLSAKALRGSDGRGLRDQKKSIYLLTLKGLLSILLAPAKWGTSGYDCSVQFFDNRIACDGPNAIPSHPENDPVIYG